jgi:excisionase family DNA binding protein
MTTIQVAQLLKVTERAVRQMAQRGEIPARRVARQWRFSAVQIHRWLGVHATGDMQRAGLAEGPESADIREWARAAIEEHRPVYEELARL